MKKAFSVCLCGLLLAACTAAPVTSRPAAPAQSAAPPAAKEETAGGSLRFSRGVSIHGDGQGMYFSLLTTWDKATVCYADYATRQMVALCADPNCAHDSEACTAFVECAPNKPEVVPVNGQLLFLYRGSPSVADREGKAAQARLELRGPTGQFIRQLAVFDEGSSFAEEYAVDDEAVYLLVEQAQGETPTLTRTLVRVSLADGRQSEIASFALENNVNYFLAGVSGERFVIKRITANGDALEIKNRLSDQEHELFLVDKQGRSEPPFKRWLQDEGTQSGVDGRLFYVESGALIVLDPEEQTTVCAQSDIFEPGMVNFLASTGPWLLLSSSVHQNADYDAPIHYAVDLETGEVRELTAVTALGQDSQFTFLGAGSEELFGSYFDQQGTRQFASISRQDLWEGRANWQVFSQTVT